MKRNSVIVLAIVACALAFGMTLAGCTQGASTQATDVQKANRAYMSQVNETMVELDASLEQFVDAVSRGDVVNMRTQADNAYKVLDKLAAIEAPEDLKDVRDSYVNGATKLRQALDAYINLYTEMANGSSVDKAAYEARIAEIQGLYDEGVALLQKGDETVAGTSGSEGASSASASSDSAASESAASSEETSSQASDSSASSSKTAS